jgi:hypothetical protein
MRISIRRHGLNLLALSMLLACNNSSTSTNIPNSLVLNGTFTAVINGTSWSPIGRVAVLRVAGNGIGISAVSTTYAMTFAINGVAAPGAYSVGAAGLQGSQVIVATASNSSWVSNNAGGTGSVTFTTVASNHIVGTFAFDAPPAAGTTGTLHVTNGVFDLTF